MSSKSVAGKLALASVLGAISCGICWATSISICDLVPIDESELSLSAGKRHGRSLIHRPPDCGMNLTDFVWRFYEFGGLDDRPNTAEEVYRAWAGSTAPIVTFSPTD